MRRVFSLLLAVAVAVPCLALAYSAPSTYVPMDSWVYPALDRMIARGELPASGAGLRPWTRAQIATLIHDCRQCEGPDFEILRREFPESSEERAGVELDAVYVRSRQIAGPPLTNSFDYGQTMVDDFGRNNREGQNLVIGAETRAESKWFASALRMEYQQSPGDSAQVPGIIELLDGPAAANAWNIDSVHRARVLDAYVTSNIRNLQFSFGTQEVHWGRGYSGSMLMGENAEPLTMLRIRNSHAIRLPWIFSRMGEWHGEFFVGKLNGHVEPFSPWLQGQRITLAFTRNLEVGFSRTIVFAGGGRSLVSSFGKSFFSVGNNLSNTPGSTSDVGDRRGGFDFQYRVPGIRNYVTLYADAFTDDDPSPLSAPRRAAVLSGIYMPQLPGLRKLDLRLETAYTDAPGTHGDGRFFYVNGGYTQAYTNNGQLLGHSVGRAGKAYQGWLNYWFSPTSKAQFSMRTVQTSQKYLAGGGRQWDVSGGYTTRLGANLELGSEIQWEKWDIPLLRPGEHHNVSVSFQMTYHPKWRSDRN